MLPFGQIFKFSAYDQFWVFTRDQVDILEYDSKMHIIHPANDVPGQRLRAFVEGMIMIWKKRKHLNGSKRENIRLFQGAITK